MGFLASLYMPFKVAGAISGAQGSYYAAKTQASNMRYQAGVAAINAKLSELDAQAEFQRGAQHVGNLTMRAGQIKGRQRASMAANGIDLDEGNALEVQHSDDIMKSIDVRTLQENAIRGAWGHRMTGSNRMAESQMLSTTASGINPRMAAFNSLLGSASSVADSWYKHRAVTEDTGANDKPNNAPNDKPKDKPKERPKRQPLFGKGGRWN